MFSEMNDFLLFVALSVSRQSVSSYRVLNVRTRWVSIHLIFSNVSYVDFNGRRDFRYFLSSFGFKVETDVGINGGFGFSGRSTWIWPLGLICDGSDGAALLMWLLLKNFLGETSVLNCFVWSVAFAKLHLPAHSVTSHSLFTTCLN